MEKSPDAFRTISEVAEELDLPQHVLRFWETRFSQIKPMKRGGGRRYYRPNDVDMLRGIKHLLYEEGYTIKGVQKLLKDGGARAAMRNDGGEYDPEIPGPNSAAKADDAQPGLPFEPDGSQASVDGIGQDGLATDAMEEVRTALGELESLKKALDQVRR